ncbi:rab GTPase-activating protein 1-like isoform X2 [Contarinia nasturtii]|uniref:rab GTPase-activating protein 1-like isoform X2 n=1 Tax=Contarinia nasturtii TaxID=265458 RepID=UPI0012D4B8F6|nr:rab GTPase-activating protein 1-like isoform X2 [Contarinia nasturtii]
MSSSKSKNKLKMFLLLCANSRHTANKMDENNTKSVVVCDSMQLESSRTQACSPDGTANNQIDMNKVGQSVFYGHLNLSPMAEKQDFMKPEQSDTDEEMSDIDQDCTEFSGVTYLGSAKINAPKSENEILRNINEMNSHSQSNGMKVSVSIPSCSEGYVVLHDSETNAVIHRYEVSRIIFYFRGPPAGQDQACFAFTFQTGETNELNPLFHCHIFRCNIPEAVNQVSSCFSKAFQSPMSASMTASVMSGLGDINNAMTSSILSDVSGNPINAAGYEFVVSLQIREKMAKTSYSAVPRDRTGFKLRANTDKEFTITVNQTPPSNFPVLFIDRCFGVLLNPGKLVRQADMKLLDMVSMGYTKTEHQFSQSQTSSNATPFSPYIIRAEWKANDKNFEQLNVESSKLSITIAVDLVIRGIQEPVRFVIETAVMIHSQHEMRLMDVFSSKKSMSQRFYLQLKDSGDGGWEVSSIDPSDEIVEPATSTHVQPSSILKNWGFKLVRSPSTISIEQDESPVDYDDSDGDEPLLSGTGEECIPQDISQEVLDEWCPIMTSDWDGKRPKNLSHLVRLGIPEKLRDKMWQRLSGVENNAALIDAYRLLLTKETKCETVIQRDINRTFPANKFFKEIGGSGQDALFKVSKAYAVYDTEVGYCQGLTFIAASLLLHMPEEEAFCVLVALMYEYKLRDLYKDGFVMLSLRLYQLNRLIKDQMPKLHEHFEQLGVETHMFASQWFLTLFTARFPLYLVFHILDVFFLDGIQILFQVALTLLNEFENELRTLDFEGILKYFRVTLPKRCRSTTFARKLMKKATERKVKRLKQYEDEFLAQKELAEKKEAATKEYELRFDEERTKYKADILMLQSKLKQAEDKNKHEVERNKTIIDDYKQIIQRQEQQITKLKDKSAKCTSCSSDDVDSSSELSEKSEKFGSKQALNNLGPLDPLEIASKQIKELELALAQTKLDLVESQCRNQDLTHQLNTLIAEIQSNRNSWQPWLAKTISSIQEKVASSKRDTPTFQSYTSQSTHTSNNSLEQNQLSPSLRPKTLPSPLSSTGRFSLDFSRMDNSPTNILNSGNTNQK